MGQLGLSSFLFLLCVLMLCLAFQKGSGMVEPRIGCVGDPSLMEMEYLEYEVQSLLFAFSFLDAFSLFPETFIPSLFRFFLLPFILPHFESFGVWRSE